MPGPVRAPRRRHRPGKLLRWLALGALALVAFLYYRPLRSYMATRAAVTQRQAEVRSLLAQKQALERRLSLAGTGADLEGEARMLGLVRPGERLFIVKGVDAWRRARAAGTHRAAK
jgi:type II secretory pathway component PulJ